MDHESRVHDADAFPSARVNAEDASPRDEAPPAGQDAVPTRYTAPIRHAVPAAPPAYALEHARQNSGEPEPAPQSPQPKKQGAVRQALRAATKPKTAEPQAPQDAPAPRFIPASTPEPPAPSSSEVSAASEPAPSQTSQEIEQDVSPRRNSIPHQAYTPKNLSRAFSQMQVGLETINARRRSLNITIGVRLAVLALLGIFEGAIIARYTTNMGWGFWLIITIYAVVQVWPLARPPKDASDASVYSVWGIFSLICFIGVGLVLSPITFLLLVLNWDGISLGLDPMIVLCTLGALWLLEIALLSVTLYKFNTLRAILARPTLSIR